MTARHEMYSLGRERVQISDTISFDELLEMLIDADIPVEAFGIGGAKTVQHLLTEVQDGESLMSIDSEGKLFREVSVLWLDVLCMREDGVYALREDRQEFRDGRVKRRNLSSSLGEKLKPGELPQDAVTRALAEEIGFNGEVTELYSLGHEETTRTPDNYPGLETDYHFHKYLTVIPAQAFCPDGYIEHQSDKTNYYVWERIK